MPDEREEAEAAIAGEGIEPRERDDAPTGPEYTPGPWSAAAMPETQNDPPGRRIFSISEAEIAPAIAYGDSDAQRDANARLIAAAPEMAEAIDAMLTVFDDLHAGGASWEDRPEVQRLRRVYGKAITGV